MIGIVGATGFIGRSLADDLQRRGQRYRAFARNFNSVPVDAFAGADALVPFDLKSEFASDAVRGLDTIVLLASSTKPNVGVASYGYEAEANVAPHCHFLTRLLQTDVRHVVYVSSGGTVYGRNDTGTPTPETAPLKPCTPYGFGKLCIETAVETIWGGSGRVWTILRPSNPVGHHQLMSAGTHGLVTTIYDRLTRRQPIDVFGDGSAVRDYFAVEDFADLIARVVARPLEAPLILNASSGHGATILDVVRACERVLGVAAELRFHAGRRPDIAYSVLDNTRAAAALDWRPTRSLDGIIRDLSRPDRP
jgi:UDP-glucose 4-epimerase